MTDHVRVRNDDHVAVVTLNRPGKLNAISLEMFDALAAAAADIAADRTIRVVVLHGEGEAFCAGIDTRLLGDDTAGVDAEALAPLPGGIANRFQEAMYAWRRLEVPVIAAVHGVAYGAGLQLALAADIRYATPEARLSIMEIKWGLIPDLAISTTLRGLVAADQVKALAYTGRVVEGSEAAGLGLITGVHKDALVAAMELAAAIRVKSPDAIRSMKRLVNEAWQLSDAEALALEARLQAALLSSPNQREAVMANLERREPDFSD